MHPNFLSLIYAIYNNLIELVRSSRFSKTFQLDLPSEWQNLMVNSRLYFPYLELFSDSICCAFLPSEKCPVNFRPRKDD